MNDRAGTRSQRGGAQLATERSGGGGGGRGGDSVGEQPKQQDDGGSGQGTSTVEWITGAVSTLLVLAIIGFLAWDALSAPASPPSVTVTVERTVSAGTGYLVEFRAHNAGQRTAAGVVVEGELRSDTGVVETSQVTIDYVPSEATRGGGLYFEHDPRRYDLQLRPKGYDNP